MRENSTVPNRYRILVRVKELVGRGARGSRPEDLAVLWCSKCGRAFAETHCRSCEDSAHRFAEVRWQFVAVLEDEVGGELVVALSGEYCFRRVSTTWVVVPGIAVTLRPHTARRMTQAFQWRASRGTNALRAGGCGPFFALWHRTKRATIRWSLPSMAASSMSKADLA